MRPTPGHDDCNASNRFSRPLSLASRSDYNESMVSIQGKLIDPWHVELTEPVPPGEDSIQVRLVNSKMSETTNVSLLSHNPAFDFLRHEPDLYE